MSQGSKKKKGIALALVLLLVMSALAVVVFGKDIYVIRTGADRRMLFRRHRRSR